MLVDIRNNLHCGVNTQRSPAKTSKGFKSFIIESWECIRADSKFSLEIVIEANTSASAPDSTKLHHKMMKKFIKFHQNKRIRITELQSVVNQRPFIR